MPVPMTGRTRGMSSLNGPKKRGDPAKILSTKNQIRQGKGEGQGVAKPKKGDMMFMFIKFDLQLSTIGMGPTAPAAGFLMPF